MISRRRFLALLAALPLVGRFSKFKYEWITGPTVTEAAKTSRYDHATLSMVADGELRRVVYGQLRDAKTGRIFTWAKARPGTLSKKQVLAALPFYPRASDWSEEFKAANNPAVDQVPAGDFEEGILRDDGRLTYDA